MAAEPPREEESEPMHVCLTTENEWRPCPEALCESGDLLGVAFGLADELAERRACLVAARDDLGAIEGAAVEDGGLWIRSVAERRRQLVDDAIASTDAALHAAGSLTSPAPAEPPRESERSAQPCGDRVVTGREEDRPMTTGTESLLSLRIRATALAVLSKESDAWTHVEWSKAAIDLASAIVSVSGDISKLGEDSGERG